MEQTRKKTEAVKKDTVKTHSDNILELKNITKTFLGGKIVANDDISLDIKRNEVHAIVGENGSGKSTLMNIIFGLYKQDKGSILFNGNEVDMYQSGAAKKFKIGMVHQHFHLVDVFSVLQNVILGQEKVGNPEEAEALRKEVEEIEKEIETAISSFKDPKDAEEVRKVFADKIQFRNDITKYKNKVNEVKNQLAKTSETKKPKTYK
ncbi:MAG: ATP-binding cassette domain-containing protein [Mycoplasmatales bacterium]